MLCLIPSTARFTRNLVAGVPHNQQKAYQAEPQIRSSIHRYTSWAAIQEVKTFPVTRILVQALSNIVTGNEELITTFWNCYTNLPEEQGILTRLIASPDPRTVLYTLVLIVNCIHENKQRSVKFTDTSVGARICISLLDRMVTLYDAEEMSDDAKAFDYGYHLFAHLFDQGFAPDLYDRLSVSGEIIAPHQTTLLKLLDSHLQSSHSPSIHAQLCPMLSTRFFGLSTYARQSIKRALGSSLSDVSESRTEGPPQELDLLLPKVCEALVLVTQCIVTITLSSEAVRMDRMSEDDLQGAFNNARSPIGENLSESLVELLQLLDRFLPRINFGKAMPTTSVENAPSLPAVDTIGFSYLKRDLVRLLGILCHGNIAIQNCIRIRGGIPVIMNLCVVDDRNPYLREHAILTLHNLLEGNAENQAVVNSIQPSAEWDENGVLREKAGVTRK
ncbi:hypothetical protein SERLA73DRAFT_124416 [Serpula lacrymans var. lacrymans S7.3]|uniref:Ataxin-10 homolog n=1 Tax=Serpula lacrymans var. lacrymans (strain S7.3) TaxID=936435 RepID=F8Q4V0_SERL3|nr:hypothetical protein SERLA73DRAFT_124416 [Serpula lacrymans var. lacrymans S7.3]